VLQSLLTRIKGDVCTLHVTDITRSEIHRQIKEIAEDVVQAVDKGRKELKAWHQRVSSKPPQWTAQELDVAAMAREAQIKFNVALSSEWRVKRHDATAVAAGEIFAAYFRGDPPSGRPYSASSPHRL
jgi:hypothetical protein